MTSKQIKRVSIGVVALTGTLALTACAQAEAAVPDGGAATTLVGPDDPNGPVYPLPRVDNGVRVNEVPPGKTASATITVLTPMPGSVGSGGSTSWTPAKVETIPPGQTEALSAAWPSWLPVLRQDSATHPGSWVNGILADPA
ncbi:hypothetical protein [Amycolatopsis sp. lyj-112]|uniref:hypothetical protein n=1 Tax=Amycolatopsis sp. lyj-112 TaxID=2789288 RepID=UPI00397D28FE